MTVTVTQLSNQTTWIKRNEFGIQLKSGPSIHCFEMDSGLSISASCSAFQHHVIEFRWTQDSDFRRIKDSVFKRTEDCTRSYQNQLKSQYSHKILSNTPIMFGLFSSFFTCVTTSGHIRPQHSVDIRRKTFDPTQRYKNCTTKCHLQNSPKTIAELTKSAQRFLDRCLCLQTAEDYYCSFRNHVLKLPVGLEMTLTRVL